MSLYPYLLLNHVDLTGADQQTAAFSDTVESVPFASPSGGWLPALDAALINLPEERVLSGRSPLPPTAVAPVDVTLYYEVDGTTPLDVLEDRIYLGQEAQYCYVGTDGAGNSHDTTNPLVAVKGTVTGYEDGRTASVANTGSEGAYGVALKLTIQPHDAILTTPIPDKPLLGYPGGLLGEVDGSVCTTGYTTLHTRYTFRKYTLVPLVWPTGASDRIHLAGNRECSFRVKLDSDGYRWELLAAFTTDAAGTIEEISGPSITPTESFRHLTLAFDTSPAGGGVAAYFYVDGALAASETSATSFHSLSGDIQLMRYESTASTVCYTIVGATMVFSSLIPAATEARLAKTRAAPNETGMVLYYPGPALVTAAPVNLDNAAAVDNGGGLVGLPSTAHGLTAGDFVFVDLTANYNGFYELHATTSTDELVVAATYTAETFAGTETVTQQSGTLYDLAEVNAASPYDATFVNCRPASLFEGDQGMAGVLLPRTWQAQHLPPTWVDAPNKIARVSDLPVEAITRAMDLGDDLALEQYNSILGFVESAPPAGSVAVTGWGGGLVKLGSNLTDNARLAVDVQGVSGWPRSAVLGIDYNDSYVSFPSTFEPGGDDYLFEISFAWNGSEFAGRLFSRNDWLGITYVDLPNTNRKELSVEVLMSGGPNISLSVETHPYSRMKLSVAVREVGADVEARVFVNGVLADSGTQAGVSIPANFQGPFLSTDSSSPQFEHLCALPMRLWNSDIGGLGEDEVAAHIRKFMFRDPVDGQDAEYADLVGLWAGPDPTDPNTVLDLIGSNDGTIQSPNAAGNWRTGLCWSDPLAATYLALRDYGGLAESDITVTSQAWDGLIHKPLSLWAGKDGEETLATVLGRAIGPGYVYLAADGTATIGALVEPTEANATGTLSIGSGGTCTALVPGADVSISTGQSEGFPPSVVRARFGQRGVDQSPDSTVDAARAALMSREFGEVTLDVGTNAVKYNDRAYPLGRALELRGVYRDQDAALEALAALLAQWEDLRPIQAVQAMPGFQAPLPGEVWGFRDPRDGSVRYAVVAARTRGRIMDLYSAI